MISGTEPRGYAMTGVPKAIDSIMTRPKGSGQSMGNSRARAPPRNSRLPASSTSPIHSDAGGSSSGRTRASK